MEVLIKCPEKVVKKSHGKDEKSHGTVMKIVMRTMKKPMGKVMIKSHGKVMLQSHDQVMGKL